MSVTMKKTRRLESQLPVWTPWKEQLDAVKHMITNGSTLLLAKPGSGKTACLLKAFVVLQNAKQARRMLVVAPLRVAHMVWPLEPQEWRDFVHLKVVTLHGPLKDKAIYEDADVFTINPEGLDWLFTPMSVPGQKRKVCPADVIDCDILTVDECSKFKNIHSKRFKTLKPELNRFKRRWPATGSPAPKGYLDLFAQVYLADQGHSLTPYITKYKSEFFVPGGFGNFTWSLQTGAKERIHDRINDICFRLDIKDLKQPKFILNPVWVELPPKARKIYDEVEKDFFTILDGGRSVEAVSAAVASGKCAQVANGGLYHDAAPGVVGARTWENLHYAKTQALTDIVDELNGHQMFIAYDFHHDLERIKETIGVKTANISEAKLPDALKMQERWNAGDIDLMLGHPASVGHGLNLQKSSCENITMHSIGWNYDDFDQFLRRVGRQGNKAEHVYVNLILAKDTVDEAKYWSLMQKGRTQDELMGALAEYRKKRRK